MLGNEAIKKYFENTLYKYVQYCKMLYICSTEQI